MATTDYFLKLTGIEGESQDKDYKGQLDIESWSWGESNMGTHGSGGGGGAGKVSIQDMHFVAKMSKASPKLFLACATGSHIKEASLICRKAGGKQQAYLTITLTDVLVTSYQTAGSAHGDVVPTDQFNLNFARIKWAYKEQKPDGSLGANVDAGYDQQKNVKI